MKRKGQDPQYTKQPASWLNARCWEDEPSPAYAADSGMLPGFTMPPQRANGHQPYRNPTDPNAYEGLLQ